MSENPSSLAGFLPAEILEITGLEKSYRASQISSWINSGVSDFSLMTNLPLSLREQLERNFSVFSSSVQQNKTDTDDTAKLLLRLYDGLPVESVLLTDERGRKTACISSQSGCSMGCRFCRTATMGLKRNLTAGEISEQYLHMKNLYGDIGNIVYMGMGEPLQNFEETLYSLRYFTESSGLAMSPRRITLSTCGIADGIIRLADEAPPVRLAVSLVTAEPEKRAGLMPVSRKYGLKELRESLNWYQKKTGRRVTLECVLLGGINDSTEEAALVAEWARGLSVIVNVIPWNPASEMDFKEPAAADIDAYCAFLERRGISVSRRYRRGRGLNAACGQLAG